MPLAFDNYFTVLACIQLSVQMTPFSSMAKPRPRPHYVFIAHPSRDRSPTRPPPPFFFPQTHAKCNTVTLGHCFNVRVSVCSIQTTYVLQERVKKCLCYLIPLNTCGGMLCNISVCIYRSSTHEVINIDEHYLFITSIHIALLIFLNQFNSGFVHSNYMHCLH